MTVSTMRAAVLAGRGEPLAIEEIPVPRPRAHEVLVRTTACGVCHTDLHVIKGEVAFPTPAVLGHEISGIVAELGSGVESLEVGDPIVSAFIMPCGTCRHCARGREDLCHPFFALNRLRGVLYDGETRLSREDGTPLWMYSMGGLAEYCVVPAGDVFRLPDGLDATKSAILGCAAFTAYGAVRHAADFRPGERVAVIALGGVGSNIVALASAFGARQVRLGRPQTFEQALSIVADGGRMVPVGIAAGDATAAVPITRLVRRSQRIVGSYGARTRTDMPAVLDLAARGAIDPGAVVTRELPLEDANAAFEALDAGQIVGRAVIAF